MYWIHSHTNPFYKISKLVVLKYKQNITQRRNRQLKNILKNYPFHKTVIKFTLTE